MIISLFGILGGFGCFFLTWCCLCDLFDLWVAGTRSVRLSIDSHCMSSSKVENGKIAYFHWIFVTRSPLFAAVSMTYDKYVISPPRVTGLVAPQVPLCQCERRRWRSLGWWSCSFPPWEKHVHATKDRKTWHSCFQYIIPCHSLQKKVDIFFKP